MIEFSLVGASGWWRVTVGGSLDDIQIRVSIDQSDEFKMFVSLQELLELYESAYFEAPPAEPVYSYAPSFQITELDDQIVVRSALYDWEAKTTYPDLRDALEDVLSEIFYELDQSGDPDERDRGLDYMDENSEIDVPALYGRLSERN